MESCKIRVDSPRVKYDADSIVAEYDYQTTAVFNEGDELRPMYKVRVCVLQLWTCAFLIKKFSTEFVYNNNDRSFICRGPKKKKIFDSYIADRAGNAKALDQNEHEAAEARRHARRLGRQQRLDHHRRTPRQQAQAHLADQGGREARQLVRAVI